MTSEGASVPVKQELLESDNFHPSAAPPMSDSAAATASSASSASPASAASSDANDPKTKRGRTSRPKVKTGCNNCKQRRIKCDEIRPSCSQCLRAKKTCSGYPAPSRSARPFEEIRIAPKPIAAVAPSAGAGASASTVPVVKPRLSQAPLPPRRQRLAAAPVVPTTSASQAELDRPLQMHRLQPSRPSLQPVELQRQGQLPIQHLPHQLFYPEGVALAGSSSDKRGKELQREKQQLMLSTRRWQKMYQRRNTPPQTPVSAFVPTMVYHPSLSLPFSQQEGQYFQLFRTHTANELSGFFDDVFWSRTVLVECHSEVAIRHAVVALGALYKTLEKTTESPPNSPASMDNADTAFGHWEVALKQYSSACHALAFVTTQDERTQRSRLMANVLLACFDSFIGDHKQAILQIQTGLRLLDELRVERRRSRAGTGQQARAAEPVEDELIQMFTRLAIQAKSYDMAFHFPQPYVIRLLPPGAAAVPELHPDTVPPVSPPASSDVGSPVSTHQDPIPAFFSSLREARLAWDTLCEHMLRFTEIMFQRTNGPPNILPKSMTRFGVQFKSRIQAWSDAFEPLLAGRNEPGVSSQEKAGIAVVKMTQYMGQILYLMTFSDSEMQFDAFRPQFKAIVDLAFEVVGDEERRAAAVRCPDPTQCFHDPHQHLHPHQHPQPTAASDHKGFEYHTSHIKASFSADLGIVPPLFVVATKSRDPILRRQAIQLLRSSARREGMWDSELMAHIGMWVVSIEEKVDEEESFTMPKQKNSAYATNTNIQSPLTPRDSPVPPPALPFQPASSTSHSPSVDFGEGPLGPGGNARWDSRRGSQHTSGRPQQPYYGQPLRPIPAEKRVLIKACEFDLREHKAILKCGTRGLAAGATDQKMQETRIFW